MRIDPGGWRSWLRHFLKVVLVLWLMAMIVSCDAPSGQSEEQSPRTEFRPIDIDNLCQNASIYVKPNREWFLGYLYAEVKVRSSTGLYKDAVYISATVNGKYRGVYRLKTELMRYYVRTDDPSIADCTRYKSEPAEVTGGEIGPEVQLVRAAPGRWRTVL